MTTEDSAKFIRAMKIDAPTLLLCDQDEVDLSALSQMEFESVGYPVLLIAMSSPLSIESLTLQQLKDAVAQLEGKPAEAA